MKIKDLKNLRPTIEAQLDRIVAAAERWREYADRIEKAQQNIEKGLIEKVESQWRLTKFRARELQIAATKGRLPDAPTEGGDTTVTPLGQERMLGGQSDFLSIEFFEAGLIAARPVGRVRTPMSFGTGFLVGDNILLTNNHVLRTADIAEGSVLEMGAEENRFGPPQPIRSFAFDPDRFFVTHKDLDFTFVAVEPQSDVGSPLSEYGHHPMIVGEGKIRVGDSVNLIQHPAGRPKVVVVHDSKLIFLDNEIKTDEFCWYTSDTDEGSSGAPVFNDHWEVIALHHASVPKTNVNGQLIDRQGKVLSVERARENPHEIVWVANEGVRTSRLVKGFSKMSLTGEAKKIRDGLLKSWKSPIPPARAIESAPRPAIDVTPGMPPGTGEGELAEDGGTLHRVDIGTGEVTIPINIVVQIGEAAKRNRK